MYQPKSVVKHYYKYDKNNNILLNIKNNKTLDKNLILKKWKNELEHKDVGKNKFFQIDNGFIKRESSSLIYRFLILKTMQGHDALLCI